MLALLTVGEREYVAAIAEKVIVFQRTAVQFFFFRPTEVRCEERHGLLAAVERRRNVLRGRGQAGGAAAAVTDAEARISNGAKRYRAVEGETLDVVCVRAFM